MGVRRLLGTSPHLGTPKTYAALFWVGLVTVVVLGLLLLQHPSKDSLAYEAAKTCFQVLGLVVLSGVVALATSNAENARQDGAANRQAEEARQAADHQNRQESFKIRAELLDRAARCAAQMYVTCRHVERLQASGGAGLAHDRHSALAAAPELLDDRFLAFSADGLTVQTEIEARFTVRNLHVEPEKGSAGIEIGESSLRWHQVYDVLTVYYFSLTGTFPPGVLLSASRSPKRFHSGLDLFPAVADASAPTAAELTNVREMLRRTYVESMPLLAKALLEEELMAPHRSMTSATA